MKLTVDRTKQHIADAVDCLYHRWCEGDNFYQLNYNFDNLQTKNWKKPFLSPHWIFNDRFVFDAF